MILMVKVIIDRVFDLVNVVFSTFVSFEDKNVFLLEKGFLFFLVGPDSEVAYVFTHVEAFPL